MQSVESFADNLFWKSVDLTTITRSEPSSHISIPTVLTTVYYSTHYYSVSQQYLPPNLRLKRRCIISGLVMSPRVRLAKCTQTPIFLIRQLRSWYPGGRSIWLQLRWFKFVKLLLGVKFPAAAAVNPCSVSDAMVSRLQNPSWVELVEIYRRVLFVLWIFM